MKEIIMIFVLFIFTLSCTNKSENINDVPKDSSGKSVYFPYTTRYSNGFDPGRPEYLRTVLDIWKEFETGDVTKTANSFEDNISITFPDQELNGPKDVVLAEFKKRRSVYSVIQNHFDSWMPAKAKDHDDEWVFIWGWQERTGKDGKLSVAVIHEIWRFNKEGKINFMKQYISR